MGKEQQESPVEIFHEKLRDATGCPPDWALLAWCRLLYNTYVRSCEEEGGSDG
jgi:hypothetical protein